ncbi:interleukin 2 receptor, gamma b [Onychostoma macrolepis]|uniref:interleukin 2 receptor, gamma b n=1 Tax=Onychostoma macrolepis TaxID=369639 RepID=UPI00272BE647|nr:interleukin 2 receptor, gamma b [Onychostoma macrolepis]
MTYIHTSKLYIALLFLFLSFQQCCSTVDLSVQCKIINLEYVECFWHPNISTMNYTFSSAFLHNPTQDCPEYIMEHSYTVGCRIPLKDPGLKFNKFYTNVSTERNHTFSKEFDSLHRTVQLNPPYNLSVVWNEQDGTLSLQWNSSSPLQKTCVVYMVRNLKDTRQFVNVTRTSYSLSHVSQNMPYVFQVRSTVADACGGSDLWSDWSTPVESGNGISREGRWQGFYGVLSVLLLFLLGLLCYCERKKIILLTVVPDPSKNLQDLFHKHDGNVESWVHISRELKEAFEPDYTETSCDVCEVTPSCDAGPTPVASPASQTDNRDEPSTEELRADDPSTEEHPTDEPSTEEHPADTEEHPADTEEHPTDEPSTEEHPADTEEHPADESSTEEHPADTEEHPADEPSTEEHPADTEEHPADTEEHPTDEPSTEEHPTDEPSTEEHPADTEEHPADTEEHPADTEEHPADEPSTDKEPAGQQSS